MDIKKIGNLLKKLRKEKELTQEQLAEEFYVSSRTVSRWETGSNLPDIDILIGLSEYYNVDIRELLDGERKGMAMEQQDKETILKAADYTAGETEDCAEGKDRIAVIIRKCGSDLKDISAGLAICFDRGFGDFKRASIVFSGRIKAFLLGFLGFSNDHDLIMV